MILVGQAAASLLLIGVALDTHAIAPELLVLAMVFVLVAQVTFLPLRACFTLLDTPLTRAPHTTHTTTPQHHTQVVFAHAGHTLVIAVGWLLSIACTNVALAVAGTAGRASWVNAAYVCLLMASYESERKSLRHFVKVGLSNVRGFSRPKLR